MKWTLAQKTDLGLRWIIDDRPLNDTEPLEWSEWYEDDWDVSGFRHDKRHRPIVWFNSKEEAEAFREKNRIMRYELMDEETLIIERVTEQV